MTLSVKAQQNRNFLENKVFTTHVANICEETVKPDPCAGQQVYLVLAFKDKKVTISEKSVTTCGEEFINDLGNYTWEVLKSNELKINTDSAKIEYTFMQDLKLAVKNGHLIGKKKDWNDSIIEYIFTDNLEK